MFLAVIFNFKAQLKKGWVNSSPLQTFYGIYYLRTLHIAYVKVTQDFMGFSSQVSRFCYYVARARCIVMHGPRFAHPCLATSKLDGKN